MLDYYALRDLPFLDTFHPPTPVDPEGHLYKEWHHFVLWDPGQDFYGLLNFGLTGGPHSKGGAVATVVALFGTSTAEWEGNLESHPLERFRHAPLDPSVLIDRSVVKYDEGTYRVVGRLRTKPIEYDIRFLPVSPPMVASFSPFTTGYSRWVLVPRLRARGWIRIAGKVHRLSKASLGYHDHNWGRFRWGDPFGWDGGLFLEPGPPGQDPLTLLVIRYFHRARKPLTDTALYVARGSSPFTTQLGRGLVVLVTEGPGSRVRRYPGTSEILFPGRTGAVPSRMRLSAQTGRERFEVDFQARHRCQLLCLDPVGNGVSSLNEMFGPAILQHTTPAGQTRRVIGGYMESVRPFL